MFHKFSQNEKCLTRFFLNYFAKLPVKSHLRKEFENKNKRITTYVTIFNDACPSVYSVSLVSLVFLFVLFYLFFLFHGRGFFSLYCFVKIQKLLKYIQQYFNFIHVVKSLFYLFLFIFKNYNKKKETYQILLYVF